MTKNPFLRGFTFWREDALAYSRTLEELHIELSWNCVNGWWLVRPSTIWQQLPFCISHSFLCQEEPNSLHKGPFHLHNLSQCIRNEEATNIWQTLQQWGLERQYSCPGGLSCKKGCKINSPAQCQQQGLSFSRCRRGDLKTKSLSRLLRCSPPPEYSRGTKIIITKRQRSSLNPRP